jgi:integrase
VVTLHSFRHLNASLLINAGLDVKTVQAALGHANASTTMNIYAHEFQTAQARACEAVSNALQFHFGA